MQVYNPNNIKIYNLSGGKSLPEWLSDRKKRTLVKKDVELRRRISLMQDFEMPLVSGCIEVSKDGQYILATGAYKPRVRCYDVSQMSMKFERCFDSEVVKMKILSDDYSKLAFLQCDRYVEFHAQHGKYYKIRIPKYGRDFDYHSASCDLYFVGATNEIYRLNLEQGRFLNSMKTSASEVFCCQFNPEHDLFTCGTYEGQVECWDPRVHNRVGILDVAASIPPDIDNSGGLSSITSIKYRDGLNFAVGTSTGQILLYDLRANKPLLIKDHNYGLSIKSIAFHDEGQNLVLSADSRILKIWHQNTGKAFTSIEPEDTKINDLCLYPKSGLLFMANEAQKMLTYYIPTLGPAPKWCSLLDNLTEELEENASDTVYDDYKFVSRTELDSLGLGHLIGTDVLRAYMHGYFMDIRLYKKAKSIVDPFAYEEYRKSKIREKIEESRQNRVQLKKLPKVNKKLAAKLMDLETTEDVKKKKKPMPNLLKDDRFSAMFKDTDFEVNEDSDEFRLLNPLVAKADKEKQKKQKLNEEMLMQFDKVNESDSEPEGRPIDEDDDSSDDDRAWTEEVKEHYKQIKEEQRLRRRQEKSMPQFYEIKSSENLRTLASNKGIDKSQVLRQSLGDRLASSADQEVLYQSGTASGSMQMTFQLKKNEKERKKKQDAIEHHLERKKIRRPAGQLSRKRNPFLKGGR